VDVLGFSERSRLRITFFSIFYPFRRVDVAKPKYDGVVEAVRYQADGQVNWVRAYERHGAVFADRVLIQRDGLIERLKSGKKFVVGVRIPYQANTFDVSQPLDLVESGDQEYIQAGGSGAGEDHLEGVPII
jgi:hypothetical protein